MTDPKNRPNLNQMVLGNFNAEGNIYAKSKNIIDATKAQTRELSELIKGYTPTIKNTNEKTTPKDFGEDGSILIWLSDSDIFSELSLFFSEIQFSKPATPSQ